MIMKKLIAIAVVFTLAVGGVFAADLGASVIGTVNLLNGDTAEGSEITGGASMNRLRIEGAGENDDGTFGAWYRWDGGPDGLAWWKPIDQVKVTIGGNPDGIFGKEGYSGWMFKQTANDTGVVSADQAWGAAWSVGAFNPMGIRSKEYADLEAYESGKWMLNDTLEGMGQELGELTEDLIKAYVDGLDEEDDADIIAWIDAYLDYDDDGVPFIKDGPDPLKILFGRKATTRDAFYGGFGGRGLLLEIKPVDMFGLNIILPYFSGGKVADIFKHMTIQADVNLDFGNIALTFDMIDNIMDPDGIGAKLYLYFGLSSIENLNLDASIGFTLPQSVTMFNTKFTRMDPLAIGLAAKYTVSDAFGLKTRVVAEFMGSLKSDASGDKPYNDPFALIFDILPFFSVSDSVTVFADIGINMVGATKYDGDVVAESGLSFHVNPYVQIGNEWGPSFFAGFKLWTNPAWVMDNKGVFVKADKTIINWEVPIAIAVSF
jgi:hypothetical protein